MRSKDFSWLRKVLIPALLLAGLGAFMFAVKVRAVVTLVSFSAIPGDGRVILLWETATELNNAGFFILRSTQPDSGYEEINEQIIPPRGDGLIGATYEYPDNDVVNGTTYWYRLEAIDFNQNSEQFYAVSVIPGTAGTQPPTATSTSASPGNATNTPQTGNPTVLAPSATSLPYPMPTNFGVGPYPIPTSLNTPLGLQNQSGTPGAEVLAAAGPTATLIPFPTISVQFPSTSTPTAMGVTDLTDEAANEDEQSAQSKVLRLWPLGVIVLIWGLIAAWFIVTQRHI